MIKFLLTRNVKAPSRGTTGSAGIDFYVPNDWNNGEVYVLQPHSDVLIPSGVKTKFSKGYALIAFNKSGVATKQKLDVMSCVVDSDYSGEIHIHVVNTSNDLQFITPGNKLVQFLLVPVPNVKFEILNSEEEYNKLWEMDNSERGEGGFGSTGIE